MRDRDVAVLHAMCDKDSYHRNVIANLSPVRGASLFPSSRVPRAVPTKLTQRRIIPRLAVAGTTPELRMDMSMARMPMDVCALLAP